MRKDYYVYGHYDSNDVLRYVGSGRKARAWSYSGCSRRNNWNAEFKNKNPVVKLFHKNLDEKTARQIEMNIIINHPKHLKPLINIIKTVASTFADWSKEDHQRVANIRSGENHWTYGKPRSDKTKRKISESRKANPTRYWLGKKRDPETVKKMIAAFHTPEARAKQANAMRGRKLTPEHRAKISAGNMGRVHTHEHCSNISKAKKGKPNGLFGTTLTEEHKAKIGAAHKGKKMSRESIEKGLETFYANGGTTSKAKQVRCLDTGNIYRSAGDAAKALGYASDKGIWKVVSGTRTTYKGMRWEYCNVTI